MVSKDTITEISDYGDGTQIVLYTEDKVILEKLRDKANRVQFYEVWKDCDPLNSRYVAADLYFPKSKKATLERQIRKLEVK